MKQNKIFLFSLILLTFVVACNPYGKKKTYGNLDLYYTKNVTEEEVDRLGHYLLESGFADREGKGEKTVQLNKENGKYQFRAVIKKEFRNNPDYELILRLFANELKESVFDNKELEIHNCDEELKTIKVLHPFLKKDVNGIIVYYDGISERQLNKLETYFKETGFQRTEDDLVINILLLKTEDAYQFKMVVLENYLDDPEYESKVKIFTQGLSEYVFNGKPVEFHYCREGFETIRVVKS